VDRLSQAFGLEHVLGGVSYVAATAATPGVIVHIGGTKLFLGELIGGTSPGTERLLEAFQRAGIDAEIPADIRVALWEKLSWSVRPAA
jgi:2-dehydropantoate 2-reductase